MDHKSRTIAKAATWQTTGFLMMAILGYITTGSMKSAGGLALSTTVIGTIFYVLHERLWAHIRWGQQ